MVKKSYKQTEIGLIPEDWEIKPMSELFEFKNGLNKEKEFFGFGTPIINYMDVFNHYGLYKKHIKGKVSLDSRELTAYSAKKGDVFFTRTSETQQEIGMSSVLLEDIKNCVFSGFVLRGRSINPFDDTYKKFCFRSEEVRKQIISSSSYTTRALTNGKLLSKIQIPLPPTLTEQKEIATALTDIDNLITNLETLITKKKAIKQGAMKQLLTGEKRLKGFAGEWEIKKLGKTCFLQGGYAFKSENFKKNNGLPIIRISNIKNNSISKKNIVFYDTLYEIPVEFEVKKGDILIAMSGATTGKVGKYKYSEKSYLNQRVGNFKLLDDSSFSKDYLYQLLASSLFLIVLTKELEQGAQPNVSGKQLENLEFNIPNDFTEQQAIAQILSDMDTEIEALAQQKSKTQHLKQGMMQELLTGKTRLVMPLSQKTEKPLAMVAESEPTYKKEE